MFGIGLLNEFYSVDVYEINLKFSECPLIPIFDRIKLYQSKIIVVIRSLNMTNADHLIKHSPNQICLVYRILFRYSRVSSLVPTFWFSLILKKKNFKCSLFFKVQEKSITCPLSFKEITCVKISLDKIKK